MDGYSDGLVVPLADRAIVPGCKTRVATVGKPCTATVDRLALPRRCMGGALVSWPRLFLR